MWTVIDGDDAQHEVLADETHKQTLWCLRPDCRTSRQSYFVLRPNMVVLRANILPFCSFAWPTEPKIDAPAAPKTASRPSASSNIFYAHRQSKNSSSLPILCELVTTHFTCTIRKVRSMCVRANHVLPSFQWYTRLWGNCTCAMTY
jgi:hypothetical protein